MATVTGYTAQRMKQIEDKAIVDGNVIGDNLILVARDGSTQDAGSVRGPQGLKGDIGEVSEAELDAAIDSAITAALRPGMLMMFAGGILPTNWLKCDGTAISRTTYAALFAVVGTSYGTGNGSTTFNVPNLSVRMPVGPGAAPYNVLGAVGGEERHLLNLAEIPTHSHDISHNHSASSSGATARHTHTLGSFGYGGAAQFQLGGQPGPFGWNDTMVTGDSPDHGHNITVNALNGSSGNNGSGGLHNNMPPYLVVNYMIHI